MVRIGIIGTAGSSKEKGPLSAELFKKMCNHAAELIKLIVAREEAKVTQRKTRLHILNPIPIEVTLVSGGAAWGDAIAPTIGSAYKAVEIHFPCEFEIKAERHFDNGKFGWFENPGRLANTLHTNFSNVIGYDSQAIFTRLPNLNYTQDSKTFHERNTRVANVDYLIAFTFSSDMEHYKGGTKDTWDKCGGHRIHVNLHTL
ncbi:Hypothetical protein POVN_LOCUS246 [uncultured virus]|nr:Hypothetical protein POVN_LOCUS246 [uncultured virus]